MNPMPELAPMLKQLRLSGILDSLEVRNKQAIDKKMAYPEFLALLISDEVARRDQKRFTTRLRRASFRSHKTLDQFDFDFNPNINSALVHELIAGRFIEEKVAVLIAGPCGTGKSHIAQAIGHAAVRQGTRCAVYFSVTTPGQPACRQGHRLLRAQVHESGTRTAAHHRRLRVETTASAP